MKLMQHSIIQAIAACLLFLSPFLSSAQGDEQLVKDIVNKLFEGMKKSDSAMMASCFLPSAHLETVLKTKDGNTKLVSEELSVFLQSISRPHTEVYDERISFQTVKVDGDLAFVWAPYQFYVGDKFSHCGVDAFCLARIDKQWKIQYLVDTRRRDGCQ